jgi:hypothetical protein
LDAREAAVFARESALEGVSAPVPAPVEEVKAEEVTPAAEPVSAPVEETEVPVEEPVAQVEEAPAPVVSYQICGKKRDMGKSSHQRELVVLTRSRLRQRNLLKSQLPKLRRFQHQWWVLTLTPFGEI